MMLCRILQISFFFAGLPPSFEFLRLIFALLGTTLHMAFRPPPREHTMDVREGKQENIRSFPTLLEDGSPMEQHMERKERDERNERNEHTDRP